MSTNIRIDLLSVLLTVMTGVSGYCQEGVTVPRNQYAPTPKALEMTRYGHMPPDLNSGVYSCDIPIYTYEDKDFSIPVSLHYSSSGFQPAKMSDEAGLHWTLMAGGAITREIVGVDDFGLNGLFGCGIEVNDSLMYHMIQPANTNHNYFGYNAENVITPSIYPHSEECSSDRYHFTFPGHSGSFVMNHLGSGFIVYGTEAGKGLYTVSYDSPSKSFTITTGDGYRYRFGHGETYASDKAREINWSREAVHVGEQPSQLLNVPNHVVTWLLDQITAPDGNTVRFVYQSNRANQDIPQEDDDVITTFSRSPGYRRPATENGTMYYKTASLTYTSYLQKIIVDKPLNSGETLEIDFEWTRSSSKEISGLGLLPAYTSLVVPRRHLTKVTVKAGDRMLRQALLGYTPSGSRPLLTEVGISGLGSYSMTYWTDSTNPLPGILCNGLDLWGYYNGQDNLSDESFCPMAVDENLDEYLNTGYMDPSWTHARLGTLQSITYPTGGRTEIEYESNQANKVLLRLRNYDPGLQPAYPELGDPPAGDENSFMPSLYPINTLGRPFVPDCGGVRVKRLKDYDGTVYSTYTYSYSGGIVQQYPRFYSGTVTTPHGPAKEYNPALRYPGSSFDQRHVAYTTVTQTNPDSSRVVTRFSNWEDFPDAYSPYHEGYSNSSPVNDSLQQLFYDHILREPDSRAYRRGQPVLRQSFDKNGTKVQEETWQYGDLGSGYNTYALYSGQYVWTARTFLCDRKPSRYVRKEWFDNTANEQMEQTDYAYNGLGQLRQTSRTVGNHTETQRITYPGDLANGVYLAMTAANYLDMPVEQVTIRDGKVVQGSLTTYNSFYNLFLPSASYHGNTRDGIAEASFIPYQGSSVDSFYELDNTFVGYDNAGNVTLSLNREGTPTTYYWDKRQDKLSAAFVGSRNGQHSYYVRGAVPHTETAYYVNANPAEKTFTCDIAGSFTFAFTPLDTTTVLSVQLDGNAISVQRIGNGAQGTASPMSVTAGTHTLRIVSSGIPLRGRPSLEEYPVTGNLSISYPKSGAVSQSGICEDCFFEDFENVTDGVLDYGFESSRGRLNTYSKTIAVVPNRTYILDYMQKVNGEWRYMREYYSPTTGSLTLTISAQQSSPVDHVRFYPADSAAASFTWWPTGELRCRVDGDGLVETYEYDTQGRLTVVRDNDGNVVKWYSYNYKH